MNKLREGSTVVTAIVLVLIGLVLQWDLVDWLIDAVGVMFVLAGIVVGVVWLVRLLSGKKESPSAY